MDYITLTFHDKSTRQVGIDEARVLVRQLEAGLTKTDFWVDRAYVYRVLDIHGLGRNTGGLWGIMTYPDRSPFAAFSNLGKPIKLVGRENGRVWLSARDIIEKHGEFTNGARRQFGTMRKRCFRILLDAIQIELRNKG